MTTRGRKIDFKQWDAISSLTQTESTNVTFSGAVLSFLIPATLLRFRGWIGGNFSGTIAAGDVMRFTAALAILSTDAFSLGATAFPDPAGEPEYPWIWWGSMRLTTQVSSATKTGEGWGIPQQRIEVDSKAMRRIKPGESLVWVGQSSEAAGAPTTEMSFGQTRVLIGT